MEELREWVERYHAWGWSLIPLFCNGDKKPARKWEPYQERRAKLKTCLKWANQYNFAVVFGDISAGLGARDFDDHASYESWVESYPQLARQLPTMRTKRGCQVFFRLQPGEEQRFRALLGDHEGNGAKKCQAGELRIGKGCYSKIPPAYITQAGSLEYDVSRFWDGEPESIDDFPFIELENSGLYVPVSKNVRVVTESTEITDDNRGRLNEINRGDLGDYAQKFDFTKISETEFVELAINSTLPREQGQRHPFIFELCRWLKAIPRFQDAEARSPELELILRAWHQRALPCIGTKSFDESMIDFRNGWKRVKFPKGQEPMNEIVQRAFQSEFPWTPRQYDSNTVRGLILICRELQRLNRLEPFYLSCRKAGELVGTDHVQANRALNFLFEDKILGKPEEHKPGCMRAQRYRYLLSLE